MSDVGSSIANIGRQINRNFIDAGKNVNRSGFGRQVSQTWKDTGRGEVGKFYQNLGGGVYDLYKNPVDAAQTGDWQGYAKKYYSGVAQNWFGTGGQSQVNKNTTNYAPINQQVGESSGAQDYLRRDDVNKYSLGYAGNYAGFSRGAASTSNTGDLSNSDRNDAYQFWVKSAAITGAIVGGQAAYSAYSAPAPAGPLASASEVGYAGDTVALGEGTLGADTVTLGEGLGANTVSSGYATQGIGAAASNSAGLGLGDYLGMATAYKVLTGKDAYSLLGNSDSGDSVPSDWWRNIGDIANKTPSAPNVIDYSSLLPNNPSGYSESAPIPGGIPMVALAAVAVAGFFVMRKMKVI